MTKEEIEEFKKRQAQLKIQRKQTIAKTKEMTKDPMKVQNDLLFTLINDNKDTEYGKKYNFDKIKTIEDYRKNVPLSTYNDYTEYLNRMSNDGERNLLTAYEVIMYNKTSGTSGDAKKIPITKQGFDNFTKYITLYARGVEDEFYGEDGYKELQINLVQASNELTKTKDGLVWGAVSDVISHKYKPYMLRVCTAPEQVLYAKPGLDIRYFQARYALATKEATILIFAYSSLLLDFFRYIEANWSMIIDDIEYGTINDSISIDNEEKQALLQNISPNPERARELRDIFNQGINSSLAKKIWPHLISCRGVCGASFQVYTDLVKKNYLGDDVNWFYRGVCASEGFFTIAYEGNNPQAYLIPDGAYYEFLEEVNGTIDTTKVYSLDELQIGKRYEMVITSRNGLYRYRMLDVYEVEGMYNNTPKLKILYRSNKTVDLIAEHMTETAFRDATLLTANQLKFDVLNNSVYPNHEKMRYDFYIEIDNISSEIDATTIEKTLDDNLIKVNYYYKDILNNGRVNPCKIHFLQPETNWLWKELRMAKGASVAQLKPVTVIETEEQKKFFFKLTEDIDNLR